MAVRILAHGIDFRTLPSRLICRIRPKHAERRFPESALDRPREFGTFCLPKDIQSPVSEYALSWSIRPDRPKCKLRRGCYEATGRNFSAFKFTSGGSLPSSTRLQFYGQRRSSAGIARIPVRHTFHSVELDAAPQVHPSWPLTRDLIISWRKLLSHFLRSVRCQTNRIRESGRGHSARAHQAPAADAARRRSLPRKLTGSRRGTLPRIEYGKLKRNHALFVYLIGSKVPLA
jgi:hypothetical protein